MNKCIETLINDYYTLLSERRVDSWNYGFEGVIHLFYYSYSILIAEYNIMCIKTIEKNDLINGKNCRRIMWNYKDNH